SVDADGNVRGVSAGNAGITAMAGGKTASIIVTVQPNGVALQSISITGNGVANGAATMDMGDTLQLLAKLNPSNASVATINWSSSDASVATVDGNGKVTAIKNGDTVITVSAAGKAATVILTVNYVAPARFKDVPKSHQFYTDIEWLADSGITSGDG
ncbi:Ig-like domain-containing protein, partial [Bifidobacterium choerinum]|uniref:Ig-like domain-containing protein n=1 Tax=Bifidobacterium choerinum TaxID=35760 RepID=UPI003F8E0BC3